MTKNVKDMFGGSHHGLDERSMESLAKALERENLPGFDYIEFKQALHNLQQMNMDESTAIRSAFATASTMGLTKEKLLKTANHYKSVLQKEKQSFDNALKKQIEHKIEGKKREVETLKKQIEEYRVKIQQLQAQIEKNEQTVAAADETIQNALANIEGVQERFELTLNSIVNQIDKDVEDINEYL